MFREAKTLIVFRYSPGYSVEFLTDASCREGGRYHLAISLPERACIGIKENNTGYMAPAGGVVVGAIIDGMLPVVPLLSYFDEPDKAEFLQIAHLGILSHLPGATP